MTLSNSNHAKSPKGNGNIKKAILTIPFYHFVLESIVLKTPMLFIYLQWWEDQRHHHFTQWNEHHPHPQPWLGPTNKGRPKYIWPTSSSQWFDQLQLFLCFLFLSNRKKSSLFVYFKIPWPMAHQKIIARERDAHAHRRPSPELVHAKPRPFSFRSLYSSMNLTTGLNQAVARVSHWVGLQADIPRPSL